MKRYLYVKGGGGEGGRLAFFPFGLAKSQAARGRASTRGRGRMAGEGLSRNSAQQESTATYHMSLASVHMRSCRTADDKHFPLEKVSEK